MNTEQRALWLLRQIMDSLPRKRDWLDPAIEGEARELVKEPAPLTPEPGVMVTVEQPGSMYNGTRGKVLAHSDGYCWVDTVRHGVVGFSPASVLVRDPVPRAQQFTPGQRVRINNETWPSWHGSVGTIKERFVDALGGVAYTVAFPDHDEAGIAARHLEPAD